MASGVRFFDFLICMIRENFSIVGYPLEFVKIESNYLNKDMKKQLLYQWAFTRTSDSTKVISICGCSYFNPKIENYDAVYVIKKKKEVDKEAFYNSNELRFVCEIINKLKSLNPERPWKRLIEILVRSTGDEELVSNFYNPLYSEFINRLNFILEKPEESKNLEKTRERWVEVEKRNRYSVYQFLLDLEKTKEKTKLCVDETIVGEYTKISKSDLGKVEDPSTMWVSIHSLLLNSTRANMSLKLKSEKGDLFSRCIIRDGVLWLSEIMIRTEDKLLRKRLYGSGAVVGTGIFNTDLILDFTKLPIIGKKYRKIKRKEVIDCCERFILETQANREARKLHAGEISAKSYEPKKVEKKEGIHYMYDAPCIIYKLKCQSPMNFSDHIKKEFTNFDLEFREKELEKARRNYQLSVFRYLCSGTNISKLSFDTVYNVCTATTFRIGYKEDKITATLKTL